MTEHVDTLNPRDTSTVTANHHQTDTTTATLFRFVSTLDAAVHITLAGTDAVDGTSFAETEALPIGGGSGDPGSDTKLVAAGDASTQVESTLLTEGWPWVRVSVTAQSSPSTGSVELRAVEDF
jgi:hypothetical protein